MPATVTTITFCNDCGAREDLCECRMRPYRPTHDEKSPVVAALLSLLIPGLGQAYNGEMTKAIVFFIGWLTIVAWPLAVMEAYYSARVGILENRLRSLGAEPEWN
ncbi:MAG: DUF5683 domain-containing protein [Planctomycetota bacterium]